MMFPELCFCALNCFLGIGCCRAQRLDSLLVLKLEVHVDMLRDDSYNSQRVAQVL
jgi:hypothetical protein